MVVDHSEDEVHVVWGERHARVLDEFVNTLERHHVRYFILRNFEGLPAKNPSKDVDIIVDPRTYAEAQEILKGTFSSEGLESCCMVQFERAHCWYGFDVNAGFSIHIDLISGYSSKGFEFLSFDELYKGRAKYGQYWVLSEPFNVVMLILYKAIGVRELSSKYRDTIRKQYSGNKSHVDELLTHIFGTRSGSHLISALGRGDLDWPIENAAQLSRVSKIRVLRRFPLKTMAGICSFLTEKADRMVFRPQQYQRLIAVEGPDGSGKSTFISALQSGLVSFFLTDVAGVTIRHFRPGLLPNLGRIGEAMGGQQQDTEFDKPHRNAPAGTLSSLIRLIYYWLDYSVGGFINARRDAQFSHFSIYDRYVFGFLIDPRRSRIALPRSLRLGFARATYQPDLTFVLVADPETVFARKQELSLHEIRRQNSELVKLGSALENCVVIDANQSTEEMVAQALRAILATYTVPLNGGDIDE